MSKHDKPIFLADVDGVLNAFRHRPGPGQPQYKWRRIQGYKIFFRPEWVEWVDGLVAVSDEYWASMWHSAAVDHFAPRTGIGTGIGRYIDFDFHHERALGERTGGGVGPYKHPGIVATVGDRPFVWIDDDIAEWQHHWAAQRNAGGIPTLLIQPDPAVGLTEEHVALAHQFLGGC